MKKTALFLILCVLAAIVFCACSNTQSQNDNGNNPTREDVQNQQQNDDQSGQDEDVSMFAGRENISDDLPDVKYDGAEIRVLVNEREDFKKDVGLDLGAAEDVYSAAINLRNKIVEDRFDVKLDLIPSANPGNDLKKSVQAQLDSYDIALVHGINSTDLYYGNLLLYVDELEYVNLDKPWYMKGATENLSVGGKANVIAGDYCFSLHRFTYCIFFNKTMAENLQLEDLYDVALDGRWTLDYMINLSKDVYKDDGNGVRDAADQYGYISDYMSAINTFLMACDNPITEKDADDIPQLVINTPKMASLVEKLYNFFHEQPGAWTGDWSLSFDPWYQGRALFNGSAMLTNSSKLRDADFDWGILPYPKWDENQEEYYTVPDGAANLLVVPTTVKDPSMVSVIIEALNAETYKKVVPAFYDNELKIKGTRGDEKAAQVIEMIAKSLKFDFGWYYGYSSFGQSLQNTAGNGNTPNWASYYDRTEKSFLKTMDKIIDKYLQAE